MALKIKRALAVALLAAVAVAVAIVVGNRQKPHPVKVAYATPGNELDTAKMLPYGWSGSKSVGTRFTDGLNYLQISPDIEGPIEIVSVTPLLDNEATIRVVGVLARVVPDMLPAGHQSGWFQQDQGFPPASPDNSGGRDPRGLVVQNPGHRDDLTVEFQIGFEVVGDGKSSKNGVEVVYRHEGETKRFVIPSYLSICAPISVKCSPEDK
ncbi:hypothetical protein KZ829_40565 [Actinoplanes hulinensis]|uniref:Secreted protein n=2 Tax=Actinoplanes TaxID=1865 RepID=A0A7W7MEZ1_9ACTN|nr:MULTISPECIES: hypothetical protein [Actinoplanes]MBB4747723.1 hypothetical protein [Actinoplanes lobatus]MBW6440036.1 hypothetical protein [Actinoplanes hulinensis]